MIGRDGYELPWCGSTRRTLCRPKSGLPRQTPSAKLSALCYAPCTSCGRANGSRLRIFAWRWTSALLDALALADVAQETKAIGQYLAGKEGKTVDGLRLTGGTDTHTKVRTFRVTAVNP